jgi:hypothetical protein
MKKKEKDYQFIKVTISVDCIFMYTFISVFLVEAKVYLDLFHNI